MEKLSIKTVKRLLKLAYKEGKLDCDSGGDYVIVNENGWVNNFIKQNTKRRKK